MPKSKIDVDELKKLLIEGYNCVKLQEHFKCSVVTITSMIRKNNLKEFKCNKFYYKEVQHGRAKGPLNENELRARKELSIKFKGENNPFYGIKHTEETKHTMSINHADFKGENNPFKKSLKIEGKIEEHKNRCKTIWNNRDKEWRENFSKKLSISMSSSKNFEKEYFHKNHKCGYLETKKAGKIWYRSSWEKEVAIQLDKLECVIKFSLEERCIKYINENNKERSSRIDFLVYLSNGNILMIEVKPKDLQYYKNNKLKIEGYKKYCMEQNIYFILIDETNKNNIESIIFSYF